MKLSADEQKICKQFGKRREDGHVRCSVCPLVLDARLCMCKKNCTIDEWEEFCEEKAFMETRKKGLGL